MILNPKRIADEGIVGNIQNPEKQIGVNGIDLTLGSISQLIEMPNIVTETERDHCKRIPLAFNDDGTIMLTPGIYDVTFNETFNIPNNMAAAIFSRSTILRGGNFTASGFFDSGFNGPGGCTIHVDVPLILAKDVRICQIIFWTAEANGEYDGIYNNKTVAEGEKA